ncbi:hypothetical protein BKA56DRAFT_606829 [Ilyonectria sp. MPI-CAGE-AT-0026]|nr:hypothetical protein BKA56DRAFT_606829 [Ilyonectria sp. MPI-CAGE-AT-0026]
MESLNPTKGCYHCMIRRISCDRTIPHCTKCKAKHLVCPGYGVRYRFVPINTIIARGDPRMASSMIDSAVEPHVAARVAIGESQRSGDQSTIGDAADEASFTASGRPLVQGDEKQPPDKQFLGLVAAKHKRNPNWDGSWSSIPTGFGSIPRILDPVKAKTRFLFDHFAERVSFTMFLIDGEENGYRNHVLPLAHISPIIQRAVCITAAFHLTPHMPELLGVAERGRAAIISHLRERAGCENALDDVTWTDITLLILGDLISGNDDVVSLYHVLASFIAARGTKDLKSPLAQFLYIQTQRIAFFARPTIGESKGIVGAGQVIPKSMESFLQLDPGWHGTQENTVVPTHRDVLRVSSEIYLLRAESRSVPVDEVRMANLVQQLRGLFEYLNRKPGSHTLAWSSFIAAAEAYSQEDRIFFSTQLRRSWEVTGYKNVLQALEILPTIWQQSADERWTQSFAAMKMQSTHSSSSISG